MLLNFVMALFGGGPMPGGTKIGNIGLLLIVTEVS